MNFVGLELFSCRGVKSGSDVEVLPCGVNADVRIPSIMNGDAVGCVEINVNGWR